MSPWRIIFQHKQPHRKQPFLPRAGILIITLVFILPLLSGCAFGGFEHANEAESLPVPAGANETDQNSAGAGRAEDGTDSLSAAADEVPPQAAEDSTPDALPTESGQEWNSRYAVALYGIRQDKILVGNEGENTFETAGLTFGPATGKNYMCSYRAHVKEAAYREDPEANLCLHWMSWEEIAEQSRKDPTVFKACLKHGCTHAVNLNLNSRLLRKDYSSEMTGDGTNAILDGVKRGFLCWNSGRTCTGGWPACRARAVLNGADEFSDVGVVREEYMLSPEESLFSCFPEELRLYIAPKAVVSDLNNDKGAPDCITTYDKLWFFSKSELYGDSSNAEGSLYQRAQLIHFKEAGFGGGFRMYSEAGNEAYAWLRSISDLSEVLNRHIYGGGHQTGSGYYNVYALAPGFCLP